MALWYIYTLNTLKRLKGHINTLQGHINILHTDSINTLTDFIHVLTGQQVDTLTGHTQRKEDRHTLKHDCPLLA